MVSVMDDKDKDIIQLKKEVSKLKAENAMLRQMIADTSNHYVEDLRLQVEAAVSEWTQRLRGLNRACLMQST